MTFEYSVWTLQDGRAVEKVWVCEGEELCEDSFLPTALNAMGQQGFQLVSVTDTRLFFMKAILADPEPVKETPQYFGQKTSKCGNEFINPFNGALHECQRELDHDGNHWSLGLRWTLRGKLVCNSVHTFGAFTRSCELEMDHEGKHTASLESGIGVEWE